MFSSSLIKNVAIGLVLAAAAALVYQDASDLGFVTFDDHTYIVENPNLRRGLTANGLEWAFTTNRASNWHPLTWISHMLDFERHGLDPAGHHRTSVYIHIANTLLLYLLLIRLTGAPWRSGLAAALFALHPLHVESVAWVSERKDVLSTLFWLLAMLAYTGYARRGAVWRYGLVILFFALGIMAKPMVVTLPFVLLLLDWWPLKRFAASAGGPGAWLRANRAIVLEKAPLLVMSAASCVVTFLVQRETGAVRTFEEIPLASRILHAPVACVEYFVDMFWPSGLAFFYPHPGDSLPVWKAFGALLVIAAVFWAVVRVRRGLPYLAMGWFWFLGTLVPVIGIVQVGMQARADRYTYIPLIGLFVAIAWGLAELAGASRVRRGVATAVAAAAVVLLGFTAHAQTLTWRSSEILYRHALEVTSGNFIAHTNLAKVLGRVGAADEALEHYLAAADLAPGDPKNHFNLGSVYLDSIRFAEAEAAFAQALDLEHGSARTHTFLAMALSAQNRMDEAGIHLREAVELDPGYLTAQFNLGKYHLLLGDLDAAEARLQKALELNPNNRRTIEALERVLEEKRLRGDGGGPAGAWQDDADQGSGL